MVWKEVFFFWFCFEFYGPSRPLHSFHAEPVWQVNFKPIIPTSKQKKSACFISVGRPIVFACRWSGSSPWILLQQGLRCPRFGKRICSHKTGQMVGGRTTRLSTCTSMMYIVGSLNENKSTNNI